MLLKYNLGPKMTTETKASAEASAVAAAAASASASSSTALSPAGGRFTKSFKIFGVEYAPIYIPIERRLQVVN